MPFHHYCKTCPRQQ
ncbi:MAG: hypothetical protein ACLFQS_02390 [Bacteroidales bacterium]